MPETCARFHFPGNRLVRASFKRSPMPAVNNHGLTWTCLVLKKISRASSPNYFTYEFLVRLACTPAGI
jgi:hypothetical protein